MVLTLTVGFSRNPRIEPLIKGAARAQNIDLRFVLVRPAELFYRNLKYEEFDLFEMSISEYLMTRERREGSRWQWIGLPIFLSKAFLWLQLYVNERAGIQDLTDLKGKRVGIPDYPMTAALWMREFLKELYGITPEKIAWYNGRTRDLSHGGILGLDRNPPVGVDLHWLTEELTLDGMLDKGEIDAAYGVAPGQHAEPAGLLSMDRYGATPIEGNPRIRRLLPDSGQQVVADYHRRTGLLPSNHMVVVKSSVLDKSPWVALELFQAFQKSKELAYQWSKEMGRAYLLFEGEDFKRQADLFGDDPYPLGLDANRGMLERLARASLEQGLTSSLACVDELFHPSTRDT